MDGGSESDPRVERLLSLYRGAYQVAVRVLGDATDGKMWCRAPS